MAVRPVTVSDGKYTFRVLPAGEVEVLRYGNPWVVIQAGCNAVSSLLYRVEELEDALAARAPEQPAPVLTVGAALALPEVQDGSHVVEAVIGLIPEQWGRRADENGDPIVMARMWRPRAERWRPWSMISPDGRQFAHRCRLVPVAEADADPSTRGPLPEVPS